MMKQKWIALGLALALLFCGGCGSSNEKTAETSAATAATAATAVTTEEESDDGTLRVIALSPAGEVDVVHEKLRSFLDLAHERYRSGDTSFSAKTDDTIGTLSSVTRFQWEIKNGSEVKTVRMARP